MYCPYPIISDVVDTDLKYVSIKTAAKLLNISVQTLNHWIVEEKILTERYENRWIIPIGENGLPQFQKSDINPYLPIPPKGYMTIREAAQKRKISRQWLYELARQGKIEGIIKSKGNQRIITTWIPENFKIIEKPTVKTELQSKMLTTRQAAKKYKSSIRRIRSMIQTNQIDGVTKIKNIWLIPDNSPIEIPPKDWLKTEEAAIQRNTSSKKLSRKARNGKVEAIKFKSKWYFPPQNSEE